MPRYKELNIYIDESGDYSPYSEENPLYSVAFVMVEDYIINNHAQSLFEKQLKNNEGGDHFVHTGNLVRAEKPYKNMLREKRQSLFYVLFLFAKYARYKVYSANVIKKNNDVELNISIGESIYQLIVDCNDYFMKFDSIVLHYDNGQDVLGNLILSSFANRYKKVSFVKTLQQDSPYMQVADLYSYFELIKYKIVYNNLSKSEIAFFGTARTIRKNYLEQLEDKFYKKEE